MKSFLFSKKYGPWALIVGAAEGIGSAFAQELANIGLNLILLDKNAKTLEKTVHNIQEKYPVQVKSLIVNLAEENSISEIISHIQDKDIGLFIYNAAFAPIGKFHLQSEKEIQEIIQVNSTSPTLLCSYFVKKMKKKQKGGIILLSSMVALQGSYGLAQYAATKAYNLVLAESLYQELKEFDIDILAVLPGATATPNYLNTQPKKVSFFAPPVSTPTLVAQIALKALGKKPSIVIGRGNRFSAWLLRKFFSRKQATHLFSQNIQKVYDFSEEK